MLYTSRVSVPAEAVKFYAQFGEHRQHKFKFSIQILYLFAKSLQLTRLWWGRSSNSISFSFLLFHFLASILPRSLDMTISANFTQGQTPFPNIFTLASLAAGGRCLVFVLASTFMTRMLISLHSTDFATSFEIIESHLWCRLYLDEFQMHSIVGSTTTITFHCFRT